MSATTTATTAPTAGRRRRARTVAFWGVLLALALLAGWLLREGETGPPLDPDSTGPDGAKAVVEVARELGARVTVDPQVPDGPGRGVALLLDDTFDDAGRDRALAWARSGGTLVVADPGSTVTRVRPVGTTQEGFTIADLRRGCDEPALAGVRRLTAPGGALLEVPPGAVGCFTRPGAEGAWLLVQPTGQGTVVRLGGAGVLTNQNLADDDNELLAAALLAPRPGTELTVLRPDPTGGPADRAVTDLLPPGVRAALWQLAVAFLVLALWRGRRLGRPVAEDQPVRIPGSELVVAVGNLLQRSGARRQAAGLLTGDLRRTLARRLGLPANAGDEQVADAAAARTGVPRDRILAALTTRDPAGEAALVDLARTLDTVRREVTRVRQ